MFDILQSSDFWSLMRRQDAREAGNSAHQVRMWLTGSGAPELSPTVAAARMVVLPGDQPSLT